MDKNVPTNQLPPLIPMSSESLPQVSSLIDPSMTRTSVETPQVEPLYSTVIPRSQRQMPQSQPPVITSTNEKKPKAARDPKLSGDGTSTTNLRIRYLEQMVSRLDKEKKAMDDEFGRQRKKFMKEMMQAESENTTAKQMLSHYVKEIEQLNVKIVMMESARDVGGSISGSAGNTETEALKQKLQVMSHEQSVRVEQLKNDWLKERKSLENMITQLKAENRHLQTSRKTKGSRDRSKSPNRNARSDTLTVPKDTVDSLLSTTATVNFTSEGSLESSMIEAAKESQLLRTVVVPLEEEIDMLRMQLKEAQERLKVYEDGSQPLNNTVTTGQAQVTAEDISEKELLEKLLNQERVARHDLEMHSDGLRRQKTVLLSDIQQLKQQLNESQNELKSVQDSYTQLQQIWEQANIKFSSLQDSMKSKLLELQHQVKQEESNKEYRLHEVGGVSPRLPRSPEPNVRKRSTSWSSSCQQYTEVSNGTSDVSWGIVEQLQRLIVGLRKDLDEKVVTIDEYKQQLERVQNQLMQEIDEKEQEMITLKSDHDKIKAALFRERKQREEIRRQLVQEKETMKSRIEQFQAQETKLRQKMKTMKEHFTEMKHGTQKEMANFGDERARLFGQLEQKREEYDCLKTVHDSEITEYKHHIDKLEQLQNEAEMNVASTMEELARVRDREIQTENMLKAQITEQNQSLAQYKMEKTSLSDQLSVLQNDLIEVQNVNNKLEKDCNILRINRNTLQEKSKAFIEDQQLTLTRLREEKTKLEMSETDLLRQVSQLKQQLATSEANQKDFVQLSQTLQVRLAEIEDTKVNPPKGNPSIENTSSSIYDDNDDLFT